MTSGPSWTPSGSERAAIMGESEGGPLAMLFAAAHPRRTTGAHPRRARRFASGETLSGRGARTTRREFEEYTASLPEQLGSW